MNPAKCAFGVTVGMFFGWILRRVGISVDPQKTKALLDMPSIWDNYKVLLDVSRTSDDFYPSRSSNTDEEESENGLPRRNQSLTWLKTTWTSGTHASTARKALEILCICRRWRVGLAQEDESGRQRPVYYLSHILIERAWVELLYSRAEIA